MSITLGSNKVISGVCGTATAVTYSIFGDSITTVDAFDLLAQGQLASSVGTLFTAGGSAQVIIKEIHLANTTGSNVSGVKLYVNGTTSSNQLLGGITIPANGTAVYNDDGWHVYDANGYLQYAGATGPTGSTGTAATIAAGTTTTAAPGSSASVSNSGSSSAATFNFTIPAGAVWRSGSGVPSNGTGLDGDFYLRTGTGDVYQRASGTYSIVANITGPTGAPGAVATVSAASSAIVVGGTTANPTVDFAIPYGGLVTAASKTYVSGDRGKYYERINGGAAMTDTLPTLNGTTDAGFSLKVANNGTTVAETITFTAAAGTLPGAATTYVLNFGCRQTFVWTGTKWLFDAGNGNIIKIMPGTTPVVSGNIPTFNDTTGRNVGDSGVAPGSLVPTTRTVSTTAPLTGGGDLSANRTLAISAATASAAGTLAAADYGHIPSGWIDVTRQGANSVLTGNTGAANNTALSAIMTAAPSGSILYFPGGFYTFASVIAVPGKVFTFQGSGAGINGNMSALVWGTNVGGDLITLTNANYYSQFADLGFFTSVTQTAGSVINVGDNANTNFYRCIFSGLAANTTLFNCINYTGTHAGELSYIDYCQFTNFSGTAIIAGSNLSTLCIDHSTVNGAITAGQAACGLNVQIGGAVQMDNSDIISCVNNVLINPVVSTVVASVFITSCYFDNSNGSCIKITGAGATVRTKISGCSITVSSTASPANGIEVSSTYAYGSLGMGLDIINNNIINTFGSTGVGTGISVTGAGDVLIVGNNIAAWATGVAVTSSSANGTMQPLINGNSIGPSAGYAGNTTGISLAAGSFTYGSVQIADNNLGGNTTPLSDASTIIVGGQKIINNNVGLLNVGALGTLLTAATSNSGAVTNLINGSAFQIPTNALRVGSRIRWNISLDKTAAGTAGWSLLVKFGTTGTTADGTIATWSAAATTAAVDHAHIVLDIEVTALGSGTSATVKGASIYQNQQTDAIGFTVINTIPNSTAGFNSTATTPFFSVAFTTGTSAVATSSAVVECTA